MAKSIVFPVLLCSFLVVAMVGILAWSAFHFATVPAFTVERLSVPKFDVVDDNLEDDRALLSVDLDFKFKADHSTNALVSSRLVSMEMGATWDEYGGARLGEAKVPVPLKLGRGEAEDIVVQTHSSDVELKKTAKDKKLVADDMKLTVVFNGTVVFSWGPLIARTYPFVVTCADVSTKTSNSVCKSELSKTSMSSSSPAATEETVPPARTGPPVRLIVQDKTVILDNGILQVTVLKPDGFITGIKYNGVDNILDEMNPEDDRGYWDVVWAPPGTKGTKGTFDRLKAEAFHVIMEKEDQVEVSFTRKFDIAMKDKAAPLDIDVRYVMLRGESGLYSYGIFERQNNYPGCHLPNARLAFKLSRQKYRYMIISDDRQRKMPLPEDRMKGRGQALDYPEAVILINPIDPEFKGELDDKYQYSKESQHIRVHGWISNATSMGFWQITPSYEFRSGGPNKQFLTSHVGPAVLAMFASAHYSGETVMPKFQDGEPWKKVYGPVFMYVNKVDKEQTTSLLWEDAKKKMLEESDAWPYSFPASDDFLKANQRATLTGRLLVHDRFIDVKNIPANGAYIGLAKAGEAGSWQRECKGYQFWAKTDADGRFTIKNAVPGEYNLYGMVNGFIGDYKHDPVINVTSGQKIDLGELIFEPPRDGPTLWEIGEPERTAKEFFIPDPNPKYVNKLYVNHTDKFRQYGLWERYTELYPTTDLVYTVNVSDYRKDWFYAQVTRKANNRYLGTTWQVKFKLGEVDQQGVYKLRIALASTTNAVLEVRMNAPAPSPAIFISPNLGNDNAIARHGIHGLYWLFNVDVPGDKLKKGENVLFLTQTKAVSPFQGIMYDYVRLEGPSGSAPK